MIPLSEVLVQNRNYIDRPEPKVYPKLSVKLYGKGVSLDAPTDGATLRMQRHQLAEPGQVILSEIWGKKGAIGIVPPEGDGALCTSHFFLFDIRRDRVEPGYLQALFFANYLAEQLGSDARGTTGYAAVRPQHLLAAQIPLPPATEQRRIVARIDNLASKLAKTRGYLHESIERASALLGSARLRLFGESPSADWVPLSNYVEEIENGWSPACEPRPASCEEWGVLKVGAVSFGAFDPGQNKALPALLLPRPEYEVRAGDFLMSRANTIDLVGACAIVERTRPKLMLSDKLFRFRFRRGTNVNTRVLDHVLKSPALRAQIERGATGTSPTMKNISKEKVMALLVPPNAGGDQRRVVSYLDSIVRRVDAVRDLRDEVHGQLEAILPALLRTALENRADDRRDFAR